MTALYTSNANPLPPEEEDPAPPPPEDQRPVVQPVSATTIENSAGIAITLVGSDPSGQLLTFYPVTMPNRGTLSLVDGNVIAYTPYDWHDGSDSFTYAAHNGVQSSDPATVSINIQGVGSKTTSRIVAITIFEDNRSHTGVFTELIQGGTTINNGFSHVHFNLNNGQGYTVTIDNSAGNFVHWQDTGSTSPTRTINIAQDTPIIAVYRQT